VNHLHNIIGVAHRDLKLENIMYCKVKQQIKVIDLGFATKTKDENGKPILFTTACGSTGYIAPEIDAGTSEN
jgi:serine/threonine protein kinase